MKEKKNGALQAFGFSDNKNLALHTAKLFANIYDSFLTLHCNTSQLNCDCSEILFPCSAIMIYTLAT